MKNPKYPSIFIGDTAQHLPQKDVQGEFVSMLGEMFYRIKNYDGMPPFFMSIVSSSNHWLFLSSTGGLSAGRLSAEQALFPYYTEDKLAENYESTGPKTILLATRDDRTSLWEPFSRRNEGSYHIERNLYKNVPGTVILFEEVNHSLGLGYRYAWRTGDLFGFVKSNWLRNLGDASCTVEFLDGIQNILPANITSLTQNTFSPLLDAYKRSELDPETGLAIYALNSTLTDLAEPSESLLATTVLQLGLDPSGYLLSSAQLDEFRMGMSVTAEVEVRGRRCAYFVHASLQLAPDAERTWHIVADVGQDSAALVRLSRKLREDRSDLYDTLEEEIQENNGDLEEIVARADGLQVSEARLCTAHHFANVMFNVMRGGTFADQYLIHKSDLIEFVSIRSRTVMDQHKVFFAELPQEFDIHTLRSLAELTGEADLIRLSRAYLPLTFSRRHGDPSRPWNRFAIDIKKPDGSLKLGYEGNWRDIFQNWEALAYSYPEYVENMICTFLNATTADGYNPYRITARGIDWESPEPGNPWANIGYWGDHQIIYLQKLMEISAAVHPGKLDEFLSRSMFSYANVPYRIKPYADLQIDPYNTIQFDWDLDREIMKRVQERGTDAKLVCEPNGQVLHVNFAEKLLTLLLAKLVNFIPEGGIWMSTQRPEWNDANNALVGKGLSVVTLSYLRRFVEFCRTLLEHSTIGSIEIHADVQRLYLQIFEILRRFQADLTGSFSDVQRRSMMDALGQAGSDYRWKYYSEGFSGEPAPLSRHDLISFLDLAQQYVEHSLRANRRRDGLYHSYNVLRLDEGNAFIHHLPEMLEGQVAIISSGMLSGEESLSLLESLRNSQLYRPDQDSYILYPDRKLPGLLERNCMSAEQVKDIPLVGALTQRRDLTLMIQDEEANYHFSGQIHNARDVIRALDGLAKQPHYSELVTADTAKIQALFEQVFRHAEFTGRSGTFFAYEGLGSIYWHMISKLLLAVQETVRRTRGEPTTSSLIEKYTDIRRGLSFNKTPNEYGAFPTDPYSHTPKGQGARQPGMTGLVKEEILTRQAELGLSVENGQLVFDFLLLDRNEFLTAPSIFSYVDTHGARRQIALEPGSLAYSICQVPVILRSSNEKTITVYYADGNIHKFNDHKLDSEHTRHIFQRDGFTDHLEISC